jgi:mRNA-degrading endonuclease RelE of RelBE toxin-antitoxin system
LPTAKNVKALTNHQYGYRLKVGNYRVLFDVENDIQIIDIQEVKKRDDNTY